MFLVFSFSSLLYHSHLYLIALASALPTSSSQYPMVPTKTLEKHYTLLLVPPVPTTT